ncbi:MAG: hypothetical protein HYW77_02200 [Parcubacteria group bacterium]|nr:hypothetical protein [Parcubacteria group bacterium]
MDIVIITVFALVSVLLIVGVREIRKYKVTNLVIHLIRHKLSMRGAFYFLVVGVLLLETSFILDILASGEHDFLWFHLSLALPAAALMGILVFWKDGTRYRFHGMIGYISIALFLGALITGIKFLFT